MQVLTHFKKQQLEQITASLIEMNEAYISKDFQLNESLKDLLNDVQEYFKRVGDSSNESKLSQLKIHLETALSGVDPVKLEK